MKSAIYMDGEKFVETEFKTEDDFEKIVKEKSKMLFGSKTIYFGIKNKVDTKSLGSSIPDGFLFDFRDIDKPEFYLVEVELSKHDFYRHIFPQITRFFAFSKNSKSRSELIDKLFSFINSNSKIEEEFRIYLGKKEIHKALTDMIEDSQNILIIIDENKPEFQEIMETYTDTWDKKVKLEILKQYSANKKIIYTLNPDFENIGFVEPLAREDDDEVVKYDESYHTKDIEPKTIAIYEKLKNEIKKMSSDIKINPQKYYISLRQKRNFAFIYIKKKKMWITIMLSAKIGQEYIKRHKIHDETQGSQRFYGGECFSVMIENEDNFDEIVNVIKEAYNQQNK